MKFKINASLLLKFYIAFLLFLIIPIVILSSVMNVNMRKSFTEIIRTNMQNSLYTLMDITEGALGDAEKIVMQITFSEKLKRLSLNNINSLKSSAKDVYVIRDVFDSIADIANSNKNVQSIYIYNKNEDYVITSGKRILTPDEIASEAWLSEYLSNPDTVSWVQTEVMQESGAAVSVISAIYPIASYSGLFDGAIIVNISGTKLIQYAGVNENSHVFIMTNDKKVMVNLSRENSLSDHNFALVADEITQKTDRQGSFHSYFDKNEHLISYNKSSYNNWYYVSVNPINEIYREVSKFTSLLIVIALTVITIGLVIAYFLSKTFYNPVKKIVGDIKKRSENNTTFQSEWKYIEGMLEETIKQDKRIKELMQKDRLNAKTTMLKQIISDAIDDWEDYYTLFPYQNYSVLLIEIDNVEEFCNKYNPKEREYILSLALKFTNNTFHSQIGYKSEGYYQDYSIILIVNSETSHIEKNEVMLDLIQNEIQTITGSTVTIAIGIAAEAGNVSASYNSAKQTLNKRFLAGYGKVLSADENDSSDKRVNEILFNEGILFNYLKLNQLESTCELVEQTTLRLTKTKNQDYEFAVQNLLLLVVSLVKYMNENGIPMQTICGNGQSIYSEVFQCNTIQKAEDYICGICEKIINFQEITNDADQFITRVMNYVHEHFNTDIDVYTMASDLNISYSQLRRIFIEYTGENIVSYTNKLRIEKAKEMLTSTEKTILEISLEVGYNNDQSFNRYFKKIEGITPGEYRKLN